MNPFPRLVRISALRARMSELRDEIRDASPVDRDALMAEAVSTFHRLRELEAERA